MKPDAPSFPCGEHAAMCSRAAGLYSEKLEIETGEGAKNVDCGWASQLVAHKMSNADCEPCCAFHI
jgi:hypothetical protein